MKLSEVLIILALIALYGVIDSEGRMSGRNSFPRFKGNLELEKVALVNQSETFHCYVRGRPKPSIVWYRDGEMIFQNKKYITDFKGRPYSLKVRKLSLTDSGDYSCRVSNIYGKIWRNFTLHVLEKSGPPTFKKQSSRVRSLLKFVGSWVDIDCGVVAYPIAAIKWFKDFLPLEVKPRKFILDGYKLIIRSVVQKNEGNYSCLVENGYGSVNWTTELIVERRVASVPVILDMKNQTVYNGTKVVFTCSVVVSGPNSKLEWFHQYYTNGSSSDDNGELHSEVLETVIFKRSIKAPQTLELCNVSQEDEGWYTCQVTNGIGRNHRSAWLTVLTETNFVKLPSKMSDGISYETLLPVVGGYICFMIILIAVAIKCVARYKYVDLKKVIIMNNNTAYIPLGAVGAVGIESHSDSDEIHPIEEADEPIGPPDVTIEATGERERVAASLKSTAKYIVPLDKKWEFPRNRLRLGKTLGEGAFGKVYAGTATGILSTENVTNVAVKTLKDDATDETITDLVKEMEIMKLLSGHKNIIRLLGCCTKTDLLLVILELAPKGNLLEFLRCRRPCSDYEKPSNIAVISDNAPSTSTQQQPPLTEKHLLSYAYQVARGMEYIALKRCAHRDLAARNILVAEDNVVKIADFGLTRNISDMDYYKMRGGRLPVKWMAPEALFDGKYTIQSDVWAFGILLWEIFTLGGNPYPSIPVQELFHLLSIDYRMPKPPEVSTEVYEIMERCWNKQPYLRPTFRCLVRNIDRLLTSQVRASQEYLDLEPSKYLDMTPPDVRPKNAQHKKSLSLPNVLPRIAEQTHENINMSVFNEQMVPYKVDINISEIDEQIVHI